MKYQFDHLRQTKLNVEHYKVLAVKILSTDVYSSGDIIFVG